MPPKARMHAFQQKLRKEVEARERAIAATSSSIQTPEREGDIAQDRGMGDFEEVNSDERATFQEYDIESTIKPAKWKGKGKEKIGTEEKSISPQSTGSSSTVKSFPKVTNGFSDPDSNGSSPTESPPTISPLISPPKDSHGPPSDFLPPSVDAGRGGKPRVADLREVSSTGPVGEGADASNGANRWTGNEKTLDSTDQHRTATNWKPKNVSVEAVKTIRHFSSSSTSKHVKALSRPTTSTSIVAPVIPLNFSMRNTEAFASDRVRVKLPPTTRQTNTSEALARNAPNRDAALSKPNWRAVATPLPFESATRKNQNQRYVPSQSGQRTASNAPPATRGPEAMSIPALSSDLPEIKLPPPIMSPSEMARVPSRTHASSSNWWRREGTPAPPVPPGFPAPAIPPGFPAPLQNEQVSNFDLPHTERTYGRNNVLEPGSPSDMCNIPRLRDLPPIPWEQRVSMAEATGPRAMNREVVPVDSNQVDRGHPWDRRMSTPVPTGPRAMRRDMDRFGGLIPPQLERNMVAERNMMTSSTPLDPRAMARQESFFEGDTSMERAATLPIPRPLGPGADIREPDSFAARLAKVPRFGSPNYRPTSHPSGTGVSWSLQQAIHHLQDHTNPPTGPTATTKEDDGICHGQANVSLYLGSDAATVVPDITHDVTRQEGNLNNASPRMRPHAAAPTITITRNREEITRPDSVISNPYEGLSPVQILVPIFPRQSKQPANSPRAKTTTRPTREPRERTPSPPAPYAPGYEGPQRRLIPNTNRYYGLIGPERYGMPLSSMELCPDHHIERPWSKANSYPLRSSQRGKGDKPVQKEVKDSLKEEEENRMDYITLPIYGSRDRQTWDAPLLPLRAAIHNHLLDPKNGFYDIVLRDNRPRLRDPSSSSPPNQPPTPTSSTQPQEKEPEIREIHLNNPAIWHTIIEQCGDETRAWFEEKWRVYGWGNNQCLMCKNKTGEEDSESTRHLRWRMKERGLLGMNVYARRAGTEGSGLHLGFE